MGGGLGRGGGRLDFEGSGWEGEGVGFFVYIIYCVMFLRDCGGGCCVTNMFEYII